MTLCACAYVSVFPVRACVSIFPAWIWQEQLVVSSQNEDYEFQADKATAQGGEAVC